MSQTLPSGQQVRILEAMPENPDPKGLVYYNYFRNLTGNVIKAYPDGTVAVSIDRKSLPEHIRTRHEAAEQAERDRWLNGLSEEDRSKLTEKEKRFQLRYTLLISAKHVVPDTGSNRSAQSAPKKAAAKPAAGSEPHRPTIDELEAKEQAYLESLKQSKP